MGDVLTCGGCYAGGNRRAYRWERPCLYRAVVVRKMGLRGFFLSPISNKIMTSSYLSPLGFTTGTSGEWGGKRVC